MKDFETLLAQGVGRMEFGSMLCNYTTWKIGGPADVLIEPSGIEGFVRLLEFIREKGIPYIVIGDGSNVLFADEGFRGAVIRIGRAMSRVTINGPRICAQAGIAVPRLARLAGAAGLCGIEHTSGIPGTLGGLAAMNGGSLRQSIGDVIERVQCVDESGRVIELAQGECDFSYRHSLFLSKPWIITDVVMKLRQEDRDEILGRMLHILRERRSKFPRRLPNCGSVFKSDAALHEKCGPPGWIIEQLGFKGFCVGGAQVSRQHANFIINTGHATAADILKLIDIIRKKAHERMGVWLECEVRYIYPDGRIVQAHEAVGA